MRHNDSREELDRIMGVPDSGGAFVTEQDGRLIFSATATAADAGEMLAAIATTRKQLVKAGVKAGDSDALRVILASQGSRR